MKDAWIPLECPACQEIWESTLNALPEVGTGFECPYCESRQPVAEFVKTQEGLKILRRFQGDGDR